MNNDTLSPPISEKPKPFEWFELVVALLLGLGAVGASTAGYESGLWNGKTTEYLARSSTLTTVAAADENKAMIINMHDAEIDLEAKRLLAEAAFEPDEARRQNRLQMASSLYARHLSSSAYADLGLPPAAKESGPRGATIPTEVLMKTLDQDLSADYLHHVYATAETNREQARQDFDTGSHAGSEGDRFALAEVLFAVSLFVSGTSLVFKTRMRWAFVGVGLLSLLTSYGFLARLQWM